MLKIQLNNSNHRRIEFTEKSSQSQRIKEKLKGLTPASYRSQSLLVS